jgi:signal transduction histidine kinase
LLPLLVVFAAVLLAIGPVVRRIRRLTENVKESAAAGYATGITVEGGDEIADLARAFESAGRDVRTQLTEKDRREQALREFLANTTHDVMIPLTVLKGHLTGLRERAVAGKPFDMGVLTSAMDEAHYIGSLMHNLAVVAKLDAGEPERSRDAVDLNALIGRVLSRHRPIARQRDVALDCALPDDAISTEGDVTLLEQAVSNIVYNAIRHNRPGGHVAIVLERIGTQNFRLRVVDDGPGLPAAELSKLVERGFRSNEARTRAPDGQGLGLHITHRVAKLHGLDLIFQPSSYGGLQVDLEGERVS